MTWTSGRNDLLGQDVQTWKCKTDVQFTYDHDTYWDTLIDTCLERRQDQLEKWRALGEPQTGREERLFKVRPTGH